MKGYRKGLYADFMMREDMELIQKEQGELEKRKAQQERQLNYTLPLLPDGLTEEKVGVRPTLQYGGRYWI